MVGQEYRALGPVPAMHEVTLSVPFPELQTGGDGQWAIVPWTPGVAHLLGAK